MSITRLAKLSSPPWSIELFPLISILQFSVALLLRESPSPYMPLCSVSFSHWLKISTLANLCYCFAAGDGNSLNLQSHFSWPGSDNNIRCSLWHRAALLSSPAAHAAGSAPPLSLLSHVRLCRRVKWQTTKRKSRAWRVAGA